MATAAGFLAVVAVAAVAGTTVLPRIIAAPNPDAGYTITSRLVTSALAAKNGTSAIAADGARLWAIDGNSVEQLNASNGSVIRTLSGSKYQFGQPTGIAAYGAHVWVTNGRSLTEVNASDGAVTRVLSSGKYARIQPTGIADDGTHLWVTSPAGDWDDPAISPDGLPLDHGSGSVTELSASNGSVIRTLSGSKYQFNQPPGITADGTHVWVTNLDYGRWVIELNASDGSVIRTLPSIAAPGTSLMVDPDPLGIATDGTRVWIADYGNNFVSELNASNGTFIRTLSDGSHFSTSSYEWGYNFPNAIAVEGTRVWITSNTGLAELTLKKLP
jgi:DNA-binding beta-propeller fold protein YncE